MRVWNRLREWNRLPPLLERTLLDDLKAALAILLGGAIGALLYDSTSVLIGMAIGVTGVVLVLNLIRWVRRRRRTLAG